MGLGTIFWLNLSPFYIAKEKAQVTTLQNIYDKIGSGMKDFNDMVSQTENIYGDRS